MLYPTPSLERRGNPSATDKEYAAAAKVVSGRSVYASFTDVCILRKQMRQSSSNASSERFKSILTAICEGKLSMVDYVYLKRKNDENSRASFAAFEDTEYLNAASKATEEMNRKVLVEH